MSPYGVDLPQLNQLHQTERALRGPGFIWCGGIAMPALAIIYGIICIVGGSAAIVGPDGPVTLTGGNATIVGIAFISLGGVLHCTCYWDSLYGSTQACARRKLLCLGIMGLCGYALCLRLLVGGPL